MCLSFYATNTWELATHCLKTYITLEIILFRGSAQTVTVIFLCPFLGESSVGLQCVIVVLAGYARFFIHGLALEQQ